MANVYSALMHFEDSLDKYRHWITNQEGKPLPGLETAIEQMQADLRVLRALESRIYDTCFKPTQ